MLFDASDMNHWRLITLLAATGALWGCSSAPAGPYGYTSSYLNERSRCEDHQAPTAARVDRFIAFYDQLESGQPVDGIETIYAEEVYFNDTLITLRGRDALQAHLQKTANNLDSLSVTLLDVLQPSHANDSTDRKQPGATYLVWEMEAQFRLLGKNRLSHTLGISQLCFNREGQVTFHQDFWDSSQGLDQHLPILGPPTRWLRKHSDTQ
ncbi:nuclear transport factor 2 family protein [Alcanivorax sp. S6407]|uniref:nuclear transport factor 2 family protein n=1 Tax=Alcanivorax sp. S6407 TaxID=2926424 RepID=UPI001FF4B54A|nr:nuclear transport factor 2 family protein [Alcanivorax sp. S6407]MCK0153021.1 nuclear transport factor 2 family protein [Alcanivorax sp. S6407]